MAGIKIKGRRALDSRFRGNDSAAQEGESLNPRQVASGLVGLRYPWWRIVLGLAALAVAAVFAASLGSVHVPFGSVVEIMAARLPGVELSADIPAAWDTILWQLRLPRVAQAAVVGAALAMSGAAYQGLFKNPLADPYLVGVASGAGLGAVVVLLTGVPMYLAGISLLPVAAFAGGTGAVVVAYSIARNSQGTPTTTLILAGRRHCLAYRGGVQPADNAQRPRAAPGALAGCWAASYPRSGRRAPSSWPMPSPASSCCWASGEC